MTIQYHCDTCLNMSDNQMTRSNPSEWETVQLGARTLTFCKACSEKLGITRGRVTGYGEEIGELLKEMISEEVQEQMEP